MYAYVGDVDVVVVCVDLWFHIAVTYYVWMVLLTIVLHGIVCVVYVVCVCGCDAVVWMSCLMK